MCVESEIRVGSIVVVKVGRNEIEVVVTEIGENRWKVKKVGGNHEFAVSKIERVLGENPSVPEDEPVAAETADTETDDGIDGAENGIPPSEDAEDAGNPNAPDEPEEEPNPAPESGHAEKKLSLLEAAAQVLKRSRTPLNTKEILAKVIESGLWTPNGGKTPEQSLYSAIFREINTKENPRFRKSAEKKGSFEYNR
ncbi:winged helix-turn-helix domain-containing protein [Victivallis lenta]|uniref:winged helix-turn-helix domain-containing protein n=1 Tax=Victivallis lenta TaxID=2606640 RepID=UPI003AB35BF9